MDPARSRRCCIAAHIFVFAVLLQSRPVYSVTRTLGRCTILLPGMLCTRVTTCKLGFSLPGACYPPAITTFPRESLFLSDGSKSPAPTKSSRVIVSDAKELLRKSKARYSVTRTMPCCMARGVPLHARFGGCWQH